MHLKQLFRIFILTVFIQFCPAQNALDANDTLPDTNTSGKEVNQTKTIKIFTSLIEGKKNTTKTNTPQLLILTNELQSVHEQYLKNLLGNPFFIDFTQKSLTAIKLEFPLKSNSTEEEFKEVTEFVKKYKIKKRPLQFMLINSKTGEEVFRVNPTSDDPAVLLKNIYQLLPDKYKGQWIDNFKAAEMISQKTNRHILINFTGSDWCIWCKSLKQEIFEQIAFKKYARKKLVLVEIDFPRKNPLPPKTALENNKLAEKFAVRGYPSVIILNPDGQLVGRTGYVRGGVVEFLAGVKQMMEN